MGDNDEEEEPVTMEPLPDDLSDEDGITIEMNEDEDEEEE